MLQPELPGRPIKSPQRRHHVLLAARLISLPLHDLHHGLQPKGRLTGGFDAGDLGLLLRRRQIRKHVTLETLRENVACRLSSRGPVARVVHLRIAAFGIPRLHRAASVALNLFENRLGGKMSGVGPVQAAGWNLCHLQFVS